MKLLSVCCSCMCVMSLTLLANEKKDVRDLKVEIVRPDGQTLEQRESERKFRDFFRNFFKWGYRPSQRGKLYPAAEQQDLSFSGLLKRDISDLADDVKFSYLQEFLTYDADREKQAHALKELALLYVSIDDYGEALVYITQARELLPRNKEIARLFKMIDDRVNPKPSVAEKIRAFNSRKSLIMSFSLGVEHASNVVQEEINSATPTNKRDTSLIASMYLAKEWKKKLGKYKQETRFDSSNQIYADHTELNIVNNKIEHHFMRHYPNHGNDINLGFHVGLSHLFSAHHSLLWNKEIGVNGVYIRTDQKMIYNADLSFTGTEYFAEGNSGEEGTSVTLNLGAMRLMGKKSTDFLRVGLSLLDESPETDILKYHEITLSLSYQHQVKKEWVKSVTPFLDFKMRNYRHGDATGKREDDQWKIGVNAEFPLNKFQRLLFHASALENKSNQASSHYKNTQVSLTYNIDF